MLIRDVEKRCAVWYVKRRRNLVEERSINGRNRDGWEAIVVSSDNSKLLCRQL